MLLSHQMWQKPLKIRLETLPWGKNTKAVTSRKHQAERKLANKLPLHSGRLTPDKGKGLGLGSKGKVTFLRNISDKWDEQKNETSAYTMLHGPPNSPLGSKRKTISKEKEREIILYIVAQHRNKA